MKKLEIIISVIAVVALIMQIFNLAFANILTALSFTTLAFIYIFFGSRIFYEKKLEENTFEKEETNQLNISKIGAVFLGGILAVLIIHIGLFMLNWQIYRIVVAILFLFGTGIIIILTFKASTRSLKRRILSRSIPILLLGFILVYTNQLQWQKIKYRKHQDYINALEKAYENRDNKELWEKVHEEEYKMRYGDKWEEIKEWDENHKK